MFSSINEWYPKGESTQSVKVATKYRKGACENCGALTHKKRDCLERPRKVGAKYSGTNFAPDERVLPKLSLGFDGKRDRWNGYDPRAHTEVLEEYKKLEEVKKEVKKERLKEGLGKAFLFVFLFAEILAFMNFRFIASFLYTLKLNFGVKIHVFVDTKFAFHAKLKFLSTLFSF